MPRQEAARVVLELERCYSAATGVRAFRWIGCGSFAGTGQDGYDWRRFEARLNAFPQVVTEFDGLDIHAIHVRSPHPGALPLILTHGWPGSVVEFLDVLEPLTSDPRDPFDVVSRPCPVSGSAGNRASRDGTWRASRARARS